MPTPTHSESDRLMTPDNAVVRTVAVLAGLVAGLTMVFPGESHAGWTELGLPFVWRDVLFVYLLSALPVALLISHRACRIDSRGRIMGEIFILLVVMGALLIGIPAASISFAMAHAWLMRTALALLMVLLPAMAIAAVSSQRLHFNYTSDRWLYAGAAGLTLLVLPVLYVEARSRHDANQVMELVGQMRFGEARLAAAQLHGLNPLIALRNRQPLSELVAQLETVVHDLEARVAVRLSPVSTRAARLERAQALAMLGRTDEALSLLQTLPDSDLAMNNLYATILENTNAWAQARDRYFRAHAGWQSAAPTEERLAGIMQACQGLGYCERKLGRIAAAEAAYLELLAVAPTAENHFLLAQFYEDTQRSSQAYTHARRAIQLNPRQFQDDGQKLINKLATSHFGCLSLANE